MSATTAAPVWRTFDSLGEWLRSVEALAVCYSDPLLVEASRLSDDHLLAAMLELEDLGFVEIARGPLGQVVAYRCVMPEVQP